MIYDLGYFGRIQTTYRPKYQKNDATSLRTTRT